MVQVRIVASATATDAQVDDRLSRMVTAGDVRWDGSAWWLASPGVIGRHAEYEIRPR